MGDRAATLPPRRSRVGHRVRSNRRGLRREGLDAADFREYRRQRVKPRLAGLGFVLNVVRFGGRIRAPRAYSLVASSGRHGASSEAMDVDFIWTAKQHPPWFAQPAAFVDAATGAWLATAVATVAFDVTIAPKVSTQTSRQAAKRLCSIRVSNFMAVLRN